MPVGACKGAEAVDGVTPGRWDAQYEKYLQFKEASSSYNVWLESLRCHKVCHFLAVR